jgi:nicotinamidase-related amidase
MLDPGQLTAFIGQSGGASALVLIHMNGDVNAPPDLIERQRQLVEACGTRGMPTFFISLALYRPDQAPYAVQDGLGDAAGFPEPLRKAARTGRCYSVEQLAGNVFADTDLEYKLKSFGRYQMILGGGMANACVKGTAIGAAAPPAAANGATQRGFTVHTTQDVILGEMSDWPVAPPLVRCYAQL